MDNDNDNNTDLDVSDRSDVSDESKDLTDTSSDRTAKDSKTNIEPRKANASNNSQPKPPKLKNKKLLIVIVSVVVLLLIGGGIGAYYVFMQPKSSNQTTPNNSAKSGDDASIKDSTNQNQSTQTNKAPGDGAKEVIEKLQANINATLKGTYPKLTITSQDGGPAYKSPSVNYAVSGDGYRIFISPLGESAENFETATAKVDSVATKFFADNYKDVVKSTVGDSASMITYYFQNDTFVCSLDSAGYPVSAACADKSSYQTLIQKLAPFAKTYFKTDNGIKYYQGGNSTENILSLGGLEITERDNGYKKATVGMGNYGAYAGGFSALFYQLPGSSDWIFFMGTQAIIPCTDYNSHDIQMAFKGDTCYDTSTNDNSVVQVTL